VPGRSKASQVKPASAPLSGGEGQLVRLVEYATHSSPRCWEGNTTTMTMGSVVSSATISVWPAVTTALAL
jgi:hypothetical protein